MELGIITKEIVCTVKDAAIESVKLYIVQLLNMDKSYKKEYVVCAENKLGLGPGEYVLIIRGSTSRQLDGNSGMPVDSAISAKVDTINIEDRYRHLIYKQDNI